MAAMESTIRSRLKTIAATVAGLTASRIVRGEDDISTSSEFFRTIVSDGMYLLIGPASQAGFDASNRFNQVDISVSLFFGFANDADYDFEAVETVLFGLRSKYANGANFIDCTAPSSISISLPEIDRTLKPIVGRYNMQLTFLVA